MIFEVPTPQKWAFGHAGHACAGLLVGVFTGVHPYLKHTPSLSIDQASFRYMAGSGRNHRDSPNHRDCFFISAMVTGKRCPAGANIGPGIASKF